MRRRTGIRGLHPPSVLPPGRTERGGEGGVLGLGKLGGEELNYSSDLDFVAIYPDEDDIEEAETTGVKMASGVVSSRITPHEFYARVVEMLMKFLGSNTVDGICYRVDMRLRPQGNRGRTSKSR